MRVPLRLAATLTLLCLAAGAARADAMADKLCPILQSVAASNASASLPELVQAQLVMQVADAYGYDHDALQAVLDGADAATTAACPTARTAILAATPSNPP